MRPGTLAGLGRTQISRSPVYRGCPCVASACAPTTRKSTLFERSNPVDALKPLFSKRQSLPNRLTRRFNSRKPLRYWTRQPVRHIAHVVVRLVQGSFANYFWDGHVVFSHPWRAATTHNAHITTNLGGSFQRQVGAALADR